MSILAVITEHPLAVGGSVLALGVVFLYARSGNSSQVITGSTDSANAAEVQAASQLQMAQLQGQVATTQSNNGVTIASQQIGAQLAAATLQSQTTNNANVLTAGTDVQLAQISADTQTAVSTLSAGVQNNNIAALLQENTNATNAETAIAMAPYQLQETLNNNATAIALASLPSNASIASLQAQLNNLGSATQGQINTLYSNIQGQLNTQGGQLAAAQSGFSALDAWTSKYWGGNVVPGSTVAAV